MKILTAAVLLLACLLSSSSAAILRFTEVDYSLGEEQITRMFTVEKTDANNGDIEFEVRALTVSDFLLMMGAFPTVLENTTTEFDPAESTDFDGTTLTGTFLASPTPGFINFDLTVIDDVINEATEVYILQIVITASSETVTLENEGVSRVPILDNDAITISFVLNEYTVQEDVGSGLDALIAIQKDIVSELTITAFIQCLPGSNILVGSLFSPSATEGQDHTCPEGTVDFDISITFLPSEQMLPVEGVVIIDDTVAEVAVENFQLQLNVPSTGGFMAGPPANVFIIDNEFAVMGFNQTSYTVSEAAGMVAVSFVISDGEFPAFYAFGSLDSADGSAVAAGDYISVAGLLINLPTGTSGSERSRSETITIVDDLVCEGDEVFTLTLSDPGFNPANVMLDPVMATVTIVDSEDCDVMCPTPVGIPDGMVTSTGTSVGDTATYTCNAGFQLMGSATTTCTQVDMNTAEFQPAPPSCVPDGGGGMGGDPHYSVLLPSGQLLCFSVQGETGFSFNLISNKLMHMNALFVQDAVRDEVTWIGELGIVVRNTPYKKFKHTKLRFVVEEKKIYIGEEVALQVQKIDKLTFSNGKLMINESSRTKGEKSPEVYVDLQDVGLSFKVRFTKSKHLDLSWERVAKQPADSHGMIGQFFRNGIEIDELRKLLLLPTMDPVPVMRKPVWHFMERETPEDQFCWAAMNPGYQGKRLIEGHYLDYLVTDILSGNFKFKAKDRKL